VNGRLAAAERIEATLGQIAAVNTELLIRREPV